MIEIWYAILSFTLLMFVVLEGFDIGAGMVQYVVGKNEAERRMVIAAIGPLWSWNEVWLIAFGGTLLLAFPTIMATAFSGFYMALFLLLWTILLRGISIELGGHIADLMWRSAWDCCFVLSNVLLAILIGAVMGNIVRGVPLDANGKFSLSLFTNFGTTGNVGILDWYTLSAAIFFLVTFAAHGATGLAKRTTASIRTQSLRLARLLWNVVVAALVIVIVETWLVRDEFIRQILHHPIGWLGILLVAGGLLRAVTGVRYGNESQALVGSSAFITGIIIAGAVGIFPFMLHSTIAKEFSLTVYRCAADTQGLVIALIWWPIALCLTLVYASFVYRHYRGRVQLAEDDLAPY